MWGIRKTMMKLCRPPSGPLQKKTKQQSTCEVQETIMKELDANKNNISCTANRRRRKTTTKT